MVYYAFDGAKAYIFTIQAPGEVKTLCTWSASGHMSISLGYYKRVTGCFLETQSYLPKPQIELLDVPFF